ncbi:MAG: DUF2304 domain-containing protein [Planctomycetota bacterium]
MTPFQTMLVIVFGLLALACLTATLIGLLPRRMALMLFVIWLAGGLASVFPDMTTRIAQLVGIDRGKDLLLYCAVVVMMIGFTMTYVRVRHLRRDITRLVRELAVLHASEQPPAETM